MTKIITCFLKKLSGKTDVDNISFKGQTMTHTGDIKIRVSAGTGEQLFWYTRKA